MLSIDQDNDVRVQVGSRIWTFNPAALIKLTPANDQHVRYPGNGTAADSGIGGDSPLKKLLDLASKSGKKLFYLRCDFGWEQLSANGNITLINRVRGSYRNLRIRVFLFIVSFLIAQAQSTRAIGKNKGP